MNGETTWRAPSLGVPPLEPPQRRAARGYDAVVLFVERARQARPNFTVTDANAAAVAQICQRLDGIALALELAAARVRTLPVERLAVELDQRFRVLTGGARTSLPRQRTLAASVDWSYDLLDDDEQTVLRRLGAFVGGFSLDAAETVCADEHLDPYDVLDLLTRLVDKSLVQLDDTTGRYRLPETVRQYVLERATAAGELPEIRGRHLAWCSDLRPAGVWTVAYRRSPCARRSTSSTPTCWRALDWSLGGEPAVALLHPLAAVWAYRSRLTDAVVWGDRVLARLEEGSPLWVRTVAIVARPRTIVGDLHFNIDVMDRALEAAERHDDRWAQTRILSNNPIYRVLVRPDTDMFAEFDRAIELAARYGDEAGEILATAIAAPLAAVSDLRRARDYRARLDGRNVDDWLHRSLHRARRHDDRQHVRQLRRRSPSGARAHRSVPARLPRHRRPAARVGRGLTQNPEWLHAARTLLPDERGHGAYTAGAPTFGPTTPRSAATTPPPPNSPVSPTSVGLPGARPRFRRCGNRRVVVRRPRHRPCHPRPGAADVVSLAGRAPRPPRSESSPPPTATMHAPKTSPTKPSPSPPPKAWSRRSSGQSRRSPPSTQPVPRTAASASPPPPPTSATRSDTGSSSRQFADASTNCSSTLGVARRRLRNSLDRRSEPHLATGSRLRPTDAR